MATISEVCEFIRSGANERLTLALKENPGLAEEKTEQGISILTYACYCRNADAVALIKEKKRSLDIFECACTGDLPALRRHLNNTPASLDAFSPDGFTLLGYSCFFGHAALARFLAEQGANLNLASNNTFKVAPLHSACAISDLATTEMLLKHGANPNMQQQAGYTPLHEAAQNGQQQLAQLLIDHGADVNALTDDKRSPYALAKEKGHVETAALIRKHGGK